MCPDPKSQCVEESRDLLRCKGNPKAVAEYALARQFAAQGVASEFYKAIFFDVKHPIPGEAGLDTEKASILQALRRNGAKKRERLLALVGNCQGVRILDAGCGLGGLSHAFAKAGASVVGLDVDRVSLGLAHGLLRDVGTPVPLLQSDARCMPFADGSFDLVLFADVFEHIHEKERILAEVRRVLRDKGRVVIHTDNKTRVHLGVWVRRVLAVLTLRNPMVWNVPWGGQAGGHVALISPRKLTRLMESMGFAVRVHSSVRGIPGLQWLLSPSFYFIGAKRLAGG